ncbi:MAG: cytochrome-c peroxidase [Verrucomicrobiota bacterium]
MAFTRWLLFTFLVFGLSSVLRSSETRVEVRHVIGGQPILLGKSVEVDGLAIEITRSDWLMSDIAFQKADGEWLEASDWVEYFSIEEQRSRGTVYSLPDGHYSAVRFLVGLGAHFNEINENEIPPDHALHPLVNGLHWGWSDGFIFSAIEGRFGPDHDGFSYHLATTGNAVSVEIPVSFQAPRDSTIILEFDLKPFFQAIRPGRESTSSHSRGDDVLIPLMQKSIEAGFRLAEISSDSFQSVSSSDTDSEPATAHGTPFDLRISERFPTVKLPADNPLTFEGVALGRRLFFDHQLSGNNSQSCASCHQEQAAFADPGEALSLGAENVRGDRNSMPLFNLAWHERFFWDGRAESLREQVLQPIEDPKEMNQDMDALLKELAKDSEYPAQFNAAFGSEKITPESIAKALEQFLITLISQDSKFDRAARGEATLTESERRGLQLFVTEFDPERNLHGADCFHCHGGNLFTNRRFTNNGLPPRADDWGGVGVII